MATFAPAVSTLKVIQGEKIEISTYTPTKSLIYDGATVPLISQEENEFRIVLDRPTAERILSLNKFNRPMKSFWKRYKASMEHGKFPYTGDTIKISRTGRLLDGQHRCKGVVESGMPIVVLVVTGLPDEIFPFCDVGQQRTHTVLMGMSGLDSKGMSNTVTHIVTMLGGNPNLLQAHDKIEFANKFASSLIPACEWGGRIKSAIKLTPSSAAAVYFLGHQINPAKVEELFLKLETGDHLVTGMPAKAIRDKWMQLGSLHHYTEAIVVGVKGMLHDFEGNVISRLRYSKTKEGMPALKEQLLKHFPNGLDSLREDPTGLDSDLS